MVMRDKKIGCLPVVEEGRGVGSLTETDILDAFIESMGVRGPGYRIELALPDMGGVLYEVVKLLKDFDANVVSVVTTFHGVPERKVLILRIETKNYKMIKTALRKSGYDILSAD